MPVKKEMSNILVNNSKSGNSNNVTSTVTSFTNTSQENVIKSTNRRQTFDFTKMFINCKFGNDCSWTINSYNKLVNPGHEFDQLVEDVDFDEELPEES